MRESHRSHMAAPTSACSGLACSPQSDTVRWAQYHMARSFQLQRASLEKHSVVQLLQAQELKNLPAKPTMIECRTKPHLTLELIRQRWNLNPSGLFKKNRKNGKFGEYSAQKQEERDNLEAVRAKIRWLVLFGLVLLFGVCVAFFPHWSTCTDTTNF